MGKWSEKGASPISMYVRKRMRFLSRPPGKHPLFLIAVIEGRASQALNILCCKKEVDLGKAGTAKELIPRVNKISK